MNLYFHKIVLLDSSGNKITQNWKIGINAYNKYTAITNADTENVIVTVDSSSVVYIFYEGKDYYFHLSDFNLFSQNNPERTFYFSYEYEMYAQLPKKCNKGTCLVSVENTLFKNDPDPFGLTKNQAPGCDYRICFLGNVDVKEKYTRKYRRLNSVIK
jgi:hypothetical protein